MNSTLERQHFFQIRLALHPLVVFLRGQQQESPLTVNICLFLYLTLRPSVPFPCRCQKRRKMDMTEGISLLEMDTHCEIMQCSG